MDLWRLPVRHLHVTPLTMLPLKHHGSKHLERNKFGPRQDQTMNSSSPFRLTKNRIIMDLQTTNHQAQSHLVARATQQANLQEAPPRETPRVFLVEPS